MTTKIKERGILMHARSVNGILAGRKTQTRRVIKGVSADYLEQHCSVGRDDWKANRIALASGNLAAPLRCPQGQPGDRLWVRETWAYRDWTEDGYPYIGYKATGSDELKENIPAEWVERVSGVWEGLSARERPAGEPACDGHWRPSLFMPRWASRITLEIVNVRVERVQDISEADCMAEGLRRATDCEQALAGYSIARHDANLITSDGAFISTTARQVFAQLWDDTNGKGAWDRNDWVWVVEFKRILETA